MCDSIFLAADCQITNYELGIVFPLCALFSSYLPNAQPVKMQVLRLPL